MTGAKGVIGIAENEIREITEVYKLKDYLGGERTTFCLSLCDAGCYLLGRMTVYDLRLYCYILKPWF